MGIHCRTALLLLLALPTAAAWVPQRPHGRTVTQRHAETDDDSTYGVQDVATFVSARLGRAFLRHQLLRLKEEEDAQEDLKSVFREMSDAVDEEPESEMVVLEGEDVMDETPVLLQGDVSEVVEEEKVRAEPSKAPTIPSVVSMEFGRPLDVLEENIPSLRHTKEGDRDVALVDEAVETVEDSSEEIVPVEEVREEQPSLQHEREGDRGVALQDDFPTVEELETTAEEVDVEAIDGDVEVAGSNDEEETVAIIEELEEETESATEETVALAEEEAESATEETATIAEEETEAATEEVGVATEETEPVAIAEEEEGPIEVASEDVGSKEILSPEVASDDEPSEAAKLLAELRQSTKFRPLEVIDKQN